MLSAKTLVAVAVVVIGGVAVLAAVLRRRPSDLNPQPEPPGLG
jgi:hypothetical protein